MKSEDKRKIRKLTERYKQELIKFCQKLVQTPSVNGEHNEGKIAEALADEATRLNLPCQLLALDNSRPNVFIGLDFDSKSGLLFIAHLDTVPAGDVKRWRYSPFGGRIKNSKLYGRGAVDCKAGIALSLYTLKVLQDLDRLEMGKFAGVVDEESGADSDLGARLLLNKGLNAEAAIYTYPGIDIVRIGHRGLVRVWIETYGEAAHTGLKSWQERTRGANAIEALAKFVNNLSEIKIKGTHKAFPDFTFQHTATLIEGGSGESIVPDRAKVLLDARFLPNQSNAEYIEKIRNLAKKFSADKIYFSVKVKTNIPGVVISSDEKIVEILTKLDQEIMGITPEIQGAGPASEGYMFINAGIPTICGFGAEGNNIHAVNECLRVDSLPKILEMYVRAAIDL